MNKNAFIIIVLILIGFLWIFGIPHAKEQGLKEFNYFDTANINGIIYSTEVKHHGASFKLKRTYKEYVFYPYKDKILNGENGFLEVADYGDSVIKHSRSDTLLLIHKGKKYNYTFQTLE